MPVNLGRNIGELAVQLRDQRVFPRLDRLELATQFGNVRLMRHLHRVERLPMLRHLPQQRFFLRHRRRQYQTQRCKPRLVLTQFRQPGRVCLVLFLNQTVEPGLPVGQARIALRHHGMQRLEGGDLLLEL